MDCCVNTRASERERVREEESLIRVHLFVYANRQSTWATERIHPYKYDTHELTLSYMHNSIV